MITIWLGLLGCQGTSVCPTGMILVPKAAYCRGVLCFESLMKTANVLGVEYMKCSTFRDILRSCDRAVRRACAVCFRLRNGTKPNHFYILSSGTES